jgi:hypothetical protein
LTIHQNIRKLRSIARECNTAAGDYQDEELAEYLKEMSVVLSSMASVLEEYDQ